MDTLRITKNQPFVLYVPLVILNADGSKEIVQAASLSDISARVQAVCGSEHQVLPEKYENFLVFEFPSDMAVGEYNILINAKLDTDRDFSLYLKKAFAVVNWDYESNWQDYLIGDHIVCAQSFIAGVFNTDADYERLKEQLQQEIERLRELQAEWLAKIAEVTDVAQQTTLVQGIAGIIEAISGIHIDIPDNIATKDDVTAAKQAILDALSHIAPEDPNSKALAEFFGVTLLQGYEFMQDTEVTDELEDIMQALDPELTAEQAASITAEAMNIINTQNS